MRPFLHTGIKQIRAAVPSLGSDFDPGHLFIIQPALDGQEAMAAHIADIGSYALVVQCIMTAAQTLAHVDVEVRYDSDVLASSTAEALLSQFGHLVQQLAASHDMPLGDLDLLGPVDAERLRKWNQPVLQATPTRSCIHELVHTMVERQPHAPAVSSWDGEFSYAALWETACRVAHHLITVGVGPKIVVGVCMDKSCWAMVSMLAILQAGGTVTALGTDYPTSRVEMIVADTAMRVALVDKTQAKRLQGVVAHLAVVNESLVAQLPSYATLPHTGVAPERPAWVVYTSGSTGTPKGVVLEHKALSTGMLAHGTLFGNSTRTRALQYASHTFGVVIEDMFTTLLFGGCTCIPSEDERLNMGDLSRMIRDRDVNFVNLTATAALLLDPRDVPGVDTVVLGGEAVRSDVVELWKGHATIINAYGQSECSVESVISPPIKQGRDAANIGFPIAGSAAWVVDPSDYNRLVPVGAPGELLIQGPLLARGYLNDAEKTEASFVMNPAFLSRLGVSSDGSSRMYRTGDLVQQNPDGSLLYLGRRDAQIKVRGQRVEAGEVESQIVQLHPDVSHAFVDLVTPRGVSSSTGAVLVAAIELHERAETPGGDGQEKQHDLPRTFRPPTEEVAALMREIRAAVLQQLPPYMVPNYFVPMSGSLPVNASGKLDRRATRAILGTLTQEQLGAFNRVAAKVSGREPSATEQQLRAAYAKVLGCPAQSIGLDDHFFQLGGDSIAAMLVVAACRRLGLKVSVRDVLQKQSISALSLSVKTNGQCIKT
jgi:amino acid adenylation domain-containing protein